MNDLLNFANEVHLLMHNRGLTIFPAGSARLQHFAHLVTLTSAYIRSTFNDARNPTVEQDLADGWETSLLDAAINDPRFSLICGDIVNFWRDPDAYVRGRPFHENALMFLAMKFTSFK